MKKILAHKGNTQRNKKFRIPKDNNLGGTDWIEISIDNDKGEFIAKKINSSAAEDHEWLIYNDSTFPSSLLREFLNGV